MIHAGLAVQKALHNHLSADVALITLLGAERVFDDVPKNTKPPYVTFAEATYSDWSTGTEEGSEHALVLNVWSAQQGRKEVLQIAKAIQESIVNVTDQLQDHALINLTHESTEVSKDIKTDLYLGRINLRAVTEPQ